MYTAGKLNTKKKSRISPSDIFLFVLALFLFSPFTAISSMIGMVGDTCIQIKLGADFIAQRRIITEEIQKNGVGSEPSKGITALASCN